MAHIHSIIDMDKHFVIDPDTRTITNATLTKSVIMQYDHNSERITFEVPRYIDGHDMSLCDVVQVHYINISSDKRTQNVGVYEIDDLELGSSEESNDVVICSWLISQNATQICGSLNFLLRYSCTTEGVVDYAWNTAIFSGITVSNGMYNGPAVVEEYADILEQWRQELFSGSGGEGMPGKSAYQYAQEGGYTGTEEEFAAKLAAECPEWAMQPDKPSYTAKEVGALQVTDLTDTELTVEEFMRMDDGMYKIPYMIFTPTYYDWGDLGLMGLVRIETVNSNSSYTERFLECYELSLHLTLRLKENGIVSEDRMYNFDYRVDSMYMDFGYDEDLATEARTVIGAVNELNAEIGDIASLLDDVNGEVV